ncbi:MAG: DUF2894 domain-containing protein [Gammaproteobacteria bacterium]|uniref:DUF2894 domain-containing protein n=1 Tax=Rhodoferax sp. TaxID=50421 RepID=UPI001D96A71E|nr:DUF2894 domain-containing protein [Rhodoferax sp.]MBU3897365.1 DUF2894 domain-containing protein [Gammaproteobacteria bacterium]MBU3999244.1 DUF2894 domain-containing protein [Gammaproteobacteria bacterium]MBU4018711.1 DUF2894 domain-containing protein [Gammaproteobacteria bacterium]MBU4079666.1 DUF2894 domain-containing protein [Gammaproteobacteria bacterium]MBU4112841.1 DUF2894 domain-containing protein [Gammaproteobacteria bacterium]
MSECESSEKLDSVVDQPVDFSAVISSFRKAGAHQIEPLEFHYIEALANRLNALPCSVKRILEGKLALALTAFGERFEQAKLDAKNAIVQSAQSHPQAAADLQRLFLAGDFKAVRRLIATPLGSGRQAPMGDLAREVAGRSSEHADGRLYLPAGSRCEHNSVQYFRDTWSKLGAAKQLTQALGRAPKNAGPINSHGVVLRSLVLMRDISPDYLNRFMSHVNALLCLEQCDREMQAAAKKETDAGKGKTVNRARSRTR